MDFAGNLAILDPVTIFQIFNMTSLTGKLTFESGEKNATFYFLEGNLIYANINPKKKIGEYFIEKELITKRQLSKGLKKCQKMKGSQRIGEILIEYGYIDRDSLVSAIQEQMEESVFGVLEWKEGEFYFESDYHPGEEDIFLDVKIHSIILEGLKRLDEVRMAPSVQE